MRILFLSPIGNIGGAERVLLTAIAGLRREAPDAPICVLMLGDGPLAEAVRELGAEVTVMRLPPAIAELGDHRSGRDSSFVRSLFGLPALVDFVRRMNAEVVRYAPDIVHSNGIKTHLLARFAVPARIPVVWHIHDFYRLRPKAGWLLRRCSKRVRVALAISDAVAADVRSELSGVRVEVIRNAVDLARFAPGACYGAELDRRAGLPPATAGTLRVGLVAAYARWKGHLTVFDAAALALDLPVRWYIVGGPIYHTSAQFTEAELCSAAEARGLAGRIGFIPITADIAPIYRALDVVLHASTAPEPFGLTVAEAMACGRAVIVSAAGGAAELFTDGIDALGIAPGSAEQLASAVRRLAGDAELRTRLGEAARRNAVAKFDSEQYGRRLLALYASLRSVAA